MSARKASGRLATAIVPRQAVTETVRGEMWALFSRYYAEVSLSTFERDLSAKDHVILARDTGDGTLCGFSTLQRYRAEAGGRSVTVIFSGDTVVERAYWGNGATTRAFVGYALRTWLSAPWRPTYWFLISKGYRTYLLLCRNFVEYWPRRERASPRWAEELIARLSRERWGADFKPERGVVQFATPHGRLLGEVAPLGPRELEIPEVAFFADKNPGHARGDELCCLGRIDARLALFQAFKHLRRAPFPKRRAKKEPCPAPSSSSMSPGSPG